MRHITLIGAPRIETSSGEQRQVRGLKAWALLARVLLSDHPIARRTLSQELFPDTDDPLGSLRWSLASIRRALEAPNSFTDDPVRSELPADVTVDVLELMDGRLDAFPVGDILDGVDPRTSPEFSTWLLIARQRVAGRIDAILREQVLIALSRQQSERAVELAGVAVRRAPFDEGAHVLLVKSLVAAGHDSAAAEHVAAVEASFREELQCEPSSALRDAAERNVVDAPAGVSVAALARASLEAGAAAMEAGAIDAGIDGLRRAASQAEAAGDDVLQARCLQELGAALVHSIRGHDDEGTVVLDRAVQLARSSGAVEIAVPASIERGYADALAGRRHEAAEQFAGALELAGDGSDWTAQIHSYAGFNLADWGRAGDAIDRYERALEAARRADDRRWQAWALALGGWTLLGADRHAEAARWLDDSLEIVRALGWVSFEPWPVAVRSEVSVAVSGRPEPDDLERCFAMSCQLEDPCWEGASGRALAISCEAAGDLEAALRWIVEARVRCLRYTDTWEGLHGAILLTEAGLRRSDGDAPGADAVARELVGLAARTHQDGLLEQGVALLAGG